MKPEIKKKAKRPGPRDASGKVFENAEETLTDLGNKERFVLANMGRLAFVPEKNQWRLWNTVRWRDDNKAAMRSAEWIANNLLSDAIEDEDNKVLMRHAKRTANAGGLNAMINLAAQSDLAIPQDKWDADPTLLGVENGVIDLSTGELLDPDPKLHISKYASVAYDKDAECPLWKKFLFRIMNGEKEMVWFLQRVAGYAMLGHNNERVLFILYGGGANGKSKFLEAIEYVLGSYAISSPTSTLMARRSTGVPNDIARLVGARMVTSIESERGHRMNEALIKSLTGNDRISARFLFNEFFDFVPVAKIFLATNHKPEVRGTDQAIWDRLVLVPFNVTIPRGERDGDLGSKLRAEAPGIFAWMLRGCLRYQRKGLARPESVIKATNQYQYDMDLIGRWFRETFEEAKGNNIAADSAYRSYVAWCEEAHERESSQREFGEEMKRLGVIKKRFSSGWKYLNLERR